MMETIMIKLENVKKYKHVSEVALLPETMTRMEAFFYEITYDLMEKIPSMECTNWSTDSIMPNVEIAIYDFDADKLDSRLKVLATLQFTADYDEVLPVATSVTTEHIIAEFTKVYNRHDVKVKAIVDVRAKLTGDAKQTLRNLGKIKTQRGYVSPDSEYINCEVSTDDEIPF
jgi:hypothetical protein